MRRRASDALRFTKDKRVVVAEREIPERARGGSLGVEVLRVTSETERYDSGVRVYVYGHRGVSRVSPKGRGADQRLPIGSAVFSIRTYSWIERPEMKHRATIFATGNVCVCVSRTFGLPLHGTSFDPPE